MKTCVGLLCIASLFCSGYCQMAGLMDNPAMMMSLMRGMGGGAGGMPMGGMPMMDLNSAPVIDPKTFAQMAKFAALMGKNKNEKPTTQTATNNKGKAANAMKLAQQQMQAKQEAQSSSGMDPMLMYFMMQQQNMDPLTMMLLSSSSSSASSKSASTPAESGSSSGGMDPMTLYMLTQSGMLG